MNIAANLELLKANKDAIRNAITRKGILTSGNDELSSYPDKIMRIGRGVVPDIPDLSVLENHEDIIYFSVMPKTYWGMTITLDTGTYTVESGTIVNGSFVSSDISAACASNTNYFCINDTDSYAIYQLTCTSHITAFVPKVDATKGTIGIAEVYGAVTSSFRNLNFTGITSLRTCTIKGTLELVTSMYGCFNNCSSLTTLDTSSWVLSAVTSMSNCFYNCSSLTTLDTSSWVLSAVTSMTNCFNNCSSLTTLDTSSWVLSAVTSMSNCFNNCSSLTTLDTSSWVLSAVTSMYGCFNNCSSLTTLDTSSWVLSAVTSMSDCFYNCSSLTTLDTSSWVLSAVTSMTNCFYNCSSLTTLDTSSWVLSAVTSMTQCFYNCSSLTTLDTSSWVLSAVTSMSNCFNNCSSLTTLDTSSWVLSAVTSMTQCFSGCSSLTSLRALNMTNCSNYDNVTLLKLVNFRYIGYGTLGANKSTILFASQVAKADIIQFFSDLYNRASAGYSVIAIIITQKAANYTSAEIAVATNKGYTVSFNG